MGRPAQGKGDSNVVQAASRFALVADGPVERYRTAIARTSLSTPVKALLAAGLLAPGVSFLDYGCGRGTDLRFLRDQHGIEGEGWDPHWRPEGDRSPADVVNLGFVLNVIEDPKERRETLLDAFRLTRKALAVAALIPGKDTQGRPFADGVLTRSRTFQRNFRTGELEAFVREVLGRRADVKRAGTNLYFVTPRG